MKYWILVLALAIGTSCAKVYYSPDAASLASRHKKIAIIPPKVSIVPRKKSDLQALKEQQKLESVNFHQEIYSWLLRRKMQNKMRVEVLDLETTIAKLKEVGYPEERALTPVELQDLLGVDGILTSNFSLSKPMSEGGAIALGLILGVWGATNEVVVGMEIYDRPKEKVIWSFNHKISGNTFSTPARLVEQLMRQASKKMPYISK